MKNKKSHHCNFCERNESETGPLVEGSPSISKANAKSYICVDCVKMCYDILCDEDTKSKKNVVKKEVMTKNKEKLLNPKNIVKYLNKVVVGQDECKKQLAVSVSNHYKRIFCDFNFEEFKETKIEKSNVILIGPTGSGKTLMAKTLAEMLDVPFAISDATSLTEAGYVGEDCESVISKLLRNCDFNVEKAQQGIVFIDEIDKIAKRGSGQSFSRDVSGEGVQQSLLKIIEGSNIAVPPHGGRKHPEQKFIHVDTTNILFICSGAFVGLENIISKRCCKQGIGFSNSINKMEDILEQHNVTQEDLVQYGMIPEFVGRLPIISKTDKLTIENLKDILISPRDAITKQYKKIFKLDNVDLSFSECAINYIAEYTYNFGTGARGLRRLLEIILNDYLYNIDDYKNKKLNLKRRDIEGILTHKKVL